MGIDFNNLIQNLGKVAASMQKNEEKIDTKTELNTYVSGWDAIKAKASQQNTDNIADNDVDMATLESQMKSELAGLLGADFGSNAQIKNKGTQEKPFFSEEDISLESMMDILAHAPLEDADGIDMKKLREYNKKPMLSSWTENNAVNELNDYGFDTELTNILMEQTPGAIKYISDAIKSGSATRISNDVHQREYDINGAQNIQKGIKDLPKEI